MLMKEIQMQDGIMTNLKDYFMSEIALVIIVLLVIYWIFRPNSGNYHLRDKEQEIERIWLKIYGETIGEYPIVKHIKEL